MDYWGDFIFIMLLVVFVAGSYLTSKNQKKLARKVILGPQDKDVYEEGRQTPPPVPTSHKRINKRKGTAARQVQPEEKNRLAETSAGEKSPAFEAEAEDAPVVQNAFTFEADELKKAVVYSEILNRKY